MKKETALKIIVFSVFGIILLWLANELFFPANYYGFGIRINGNLGGDHMYMNGNYGYGAGTFTILLVFLLKFLVVIFVIALIVGFVMIAKNYLFNAQDIAALKAGYTPVEKTKRTCEICGKIVEDKWKVCPYCGAEIKDK